MKHHLVYKITNTTNGKIYIGAHQTDDIDDGYFGSGKALKSAIRKYGKEVFFKEILHDLPTKDAMYMMERELVTQDFINRQDTYNMKIGGEGGGHNKPHSEETKKKLSLRKKGTLPHNTGKERPDWVRQKISTTLKGSVLSEDTKAKMSAAHAGNPKPQSMKDKLSAQRKGKPLPTGICKYCGGRFTIPALGRYHNEKCKMKGI